MHKPLSILTICVLGFCCSKSSSHAGTNVEIYLAKSYQLVSGKCQVDPATVVLQDTPILKNRDILYYTASTHEYTITDTAVLKLNALQPRAPFALTVDKQVIFYGITMPPTLSSSCDQSIAMTIFFPSQGKVPMQLGYPGATSSTVIDDQRNNPTLIATLQNQGKLK